LKNLPCTLSCEIIESLNAIVIAYTRIDVLFAVHKIFTFEQNYGAKMTTFHTTFHPSRELFFSIGVVVITLVLSQ
jgi:hypothetical protein